MPASRETRGGGRGGSRGSVRWGWGGSSKSPGQTVSSVGPRPPDKPSGLSGRGLQVSPWLRDSTRAGAELPTQELVQG